MNQTRVNKLLVVVVIFLIVSLTYVWVVRKEKSGIPSTNTAVTSEISYAPNEWKTWTDNFYSESSGENFSYELRYPRDFDVLGGESAFGGFIGKNDVNLAFPKDAFQTPKTNYGEAYLAISVGTDKLSLDGCYENPITGEQFSDTEVINGTMFHSGSIQDSAAGNIYDSKIYRVLVDGRCLEIARTIHTSNISNYPAGTVTEFDQANAISVLDQMIGTLTIATSTKTP